MAESDFPTEHARPASGRVHSTSSGRLAETPLAHVLMYVMRRNMTGTLILWPDAIDSCEDRLFFDRGLPIAANFKRRIRTLGEGIYALMSRQGAFDLYAEVDLTDEQDLVRGRVDPPALVGEWLRHEAPDAAMEQVLSRIGEQTPLSLRPEFDRGRLHLIEEEQSIIRTLMKESATTPELIARSPLSEERARRLVYLLVITGAAGPAVASQSSWPPPRAISPGEERELALTELQRARRCMRRRQWNAAIRILRIAIEHSDFDATLHAELAFCLYNKYAGRPDDEGPWPRILRTVNEALRRDTNSSRAHYYKGMILTRMGDRERACAHFRKAVDLDAHCTDAKRELYLAAKNKRPSFISWLLKK